MPRKPDPRSGLDERGAWTPVFDGQRRPAEPGNSLALKHGSYSLQRLAPRAAELADAVRELAPIRSSADEPMVRTFGLVLARLERVSLASEQASGEESHRLDEDTRRWSLAALKFAEALGMTPTARARLGIDLARAENEAERSRDLAEARRAREQSERRLREEAV